MLSFKIVPIKGTNQIARGIISATEENLLDRLAKSHERAKSAERFNVVVDDQVIRSFINENGTLIEDTEMKQSTSEIVRGMMLSGKPFTRAQLIQRVHLNAPDKDNKTILNTVGALMSTIAKKHNLSKTVDKIDLDGKKRKLFQFTVAA